MKFILALCVILFSAALPAMAAEETGLTGYHAQLYKMCEHKAGRACCRASVRQMRKENGFPVAAQEQCPKGAEHRNLPCPASMNWCTYTPKSFD